MAQLRHDYQQFREANAEILVVAPDDPDDLRKYWQSESLPFPGLADPEHRVANTYRQEVNLLKLGRMPALLIVDRDGDIVYQHYSASMSDIPANADVLRTLTKLNAEAADAARAG